MHVKQIDFLLKLYKNTKLENEIYKYFSENSIEPLLLLDGNYNIKQFNSAFSRKFGYDLEEIYNKPFQNFLLPTDINYFNDILNKLVTNQYIDDDYILLNIRHKCDVFVPVICSFGVFINNIDPSKNTFFFSIQDKSECKIKNVKIDKIEKCINFVCKNIDNLFVITTDTGIIVQYNNQFKELLNLSSLNELIGKSIFDQFDESDNIKEFILNDQQYMSSFELNLKIKDNRTLPVLVKILRVTFNNVTSFVYIIRDIQIRKKKEELLKQTSTINATLVSTVDFNYNIKNVLNLLLNYTNSSNCLVFENKDHIEQNYFKCIFNESTFYNNKIKTNILFPYEIFEFIVMNREPLIVENINNFNDKKIPKFSVFIDYLKSLSCESFLMYPLYLGSYLWGVIFLLRKYPSTFDNSIIDLLEVISNSLINVIQRDRIEDFLQGKLVQKTNDLEKSNKDLEEFAYYISHDLVSPVRQMSICINSIEREMEKQKCQMSEDMKIDFDFLKEGCKRMIDRVQGLLTYSKLNTRKIKYVPVDVNKVLDNVLFDLSQIIEENNINIILCKDVYPIISADKQLCEQVFQNLISNAVKFSKNNDDSFIKIDYSINNENKCVFCIEDNGIGIEEKYLKKIFNIFMKVNTSNDSSSNNNDGCGIGLSLVKRIIDLHNQKLWVESVYGEGTKFFFTFNLYSKDGI